MQKPKKIVILDENPKEQNYFLEFLLYKSLFENHGIQTEIFDMDEFHSLWTKNSPHIPLENILVYNRSTDFFLTGATHSRDWLRRSFEEKNLCLVPNPWEYEVLAHKTNLIEWSKRGFLHPYLPMAAVLTSDNAAEIWKTRKQWFFKDQAAFGGKRAYSGATLTRSKFEELVSLSTSMVQEIVPAAKFQIESLAGEDNLFKSDLRFYFYKNRLLTGVGRLYQGQVTNFRTPGGGFCALQFS